MGFTTFARLPGSCIRYFMMFDDICLPELGLPQPQVVTPANIPTMCKWVSAKQQMWPQPQCRIYRSRLLGWRCDAMHCVAACQGKPHCGSSEKRSQLGLLGSWTTVSRYQ